MAEATATPSTAVERVATGTPESINLARVGDGYSSIKGADFATRKQVLTLVSNSTPIDDQRDKTFALANIIVQPVVVQGNNATRVTLIDQEGNAFHGTSEGLLSSVKNILGILGEPGSWPEPLSIQVVEERANNGFKFFTIKYV